MDRDYDIFEKFPDGGLRWIEVVHGRASALSRLREIAATSPNEIYAIYLPTREIIATLNA